MKKQLTKVFVALLTLLIVTSLVVFPTAVVDQTVMAQETPEVHINWGNTLTPEADQTVPDQYPSSEFIIERPTGQTSPQFLDPSLTAAAEEKAMNIIQNVMSVDLSKYNLQFRHSSLMDGTPLSNDGRKIIDLLYVLIPKQGIVNEDNQIILAFSVEKDVIRSYFILPVESPVITTTSYANQRAAVKDFLEKYQTYTNIDSSNLIEMLNNVDLTKNSTTIQGNTKFTVTLGRNMGVEHTSLKWAYTVDGADYTSLSISVNADGFVTSMRDDRLLYTIGDTSIKVSMEQAVDIAIANLGSYSYKMPDGSVVSEFNVDKDFTLPELFTVAVDYELRPYWDVTLYLDEVYPGSVFAIKAFIWANTGEIISYGNMATGGAVNADINSAISSTVAAKQNSNNLYIGIAIIAVIAVVATGMLLVRKRRK